jgi:hypothetical protein
MFPLLQTAVAVLGTGFLFVTGVVVVDNVVNEDEPVVDEVVAEGVSSGVAAEAGTTTDQVVVHESETSVNSTSTATIESEPIVLPISEPPILETSIIEPTAAVDGVAEAPIYDIETIRDLVAEVESYDVPTSREDCDNEDDILACLGELREFRRR